MYNLSAYVNPRGCGLGSARGSNAESTVSGMEWGGGPQLGHQPFGIVRKLHVRTTMRLCTALLLLALLAAGAACGSCILDAGAADPGVTNPSAGASGSAEGTGGHVLGAQQAAAGGSGGAGLPAASVAPRRALQQGAGNTPLIKGAHSQYAADKVHWAGLQAVQSCPSLPRCCRSTQAAADQSPGPGHRAAPDFRHLHW